MLVSWVDRDHAMLSTLVRSRMPHPSQDTVRDLMPSGIHVGVGGSPSIPSSSFRLSQQQTAQQRILFSPTVTGYCSSSLIATAMMRPSVWASSFGPPSRPVYHCEITSPVKYFPAMASEKFTIHTWSSKHKHRHPTQQPWSPLHKRGANNFTNHVCGLWDFEYCHVLSFFLDHNAMLDRSLR